MMIGYGPKEAFEKYYKPRRLRQDKKIKFKRQQYAYIINTFFKFMRKLLLDEGEKIYLPYRLGSLQVIGIKEKAVIDQEGRIKGIAVNWHKTRLLWKKQPELKFKKYIYFLNEATGGVRYKFFWSTKDVPYRTKAARNMMLTAQNRKYLYHNIINDILPYEVVERNLRAKKVLLKPKWKKK